jgi:hypothetical protein
VLGSSWTLHVRFGLTLAAVMANNTSQQTLGCGSNMHLRERQRRGVRRREDALPIQEAGIRAECVLQERHSMQSFEPLCRGNSA